MSEQNSLHSVQSNFVDEAKGEDVANIDYKGEFEILEKEYEQVKKNRTFWQRVQLFEYELHFENKTHMVYVLGFFACMAGILSGVDQSLISGANLDMPDALHLTSRESSLCSSLMPLGAVLGSLIMTPLNEFFGRRMSLIVSCVFYTVGAILEAASQSFTEMAPGRFLLGVGVGIEGGCVGIYVAECVPSSVRGSLVSLYQFNIALGEVFGYAIAAIFLNVKGNWRFTLGSSLLFSTILFFGLFFLPESPRYLMHKQRIGEAYGVWKRLRDLNDHENQVEFFEMKEAAILEKESNLSENKRRYIWLDFFTVPRCRRSLIYANAMIFLGQFTGVNGVMYYMSTLLQNIGFSDKNSVFMSLVGGVSLLLGAIPAILYMDKYGRRTWANYMLPGFFVGLVLIGISYRIDYNTHKAAAEGLYLTGLILYMGFFGSYACLTWVVPSEVYPTYLRSYGMTISSAFLYLLCFIITYNFTSMQSAMTNTGLMLGFFGGIAVLGWIYQLLYMPETKNKTLEEIDDIFSLPTRTVVAHNLSNMKKSIWN